jgi:hypothetical protein
MPYVYTRMVTFVRIHAHEIIALILKDKSTSSFGITRLLLTALAPINAILIVTFLDPSEQGYLYTMYSLVALAYYAELGLGQVLTQMVSEVFVKSGAGPDSPTLPLYNYLKFTLRSGVLLFFVTALVSFIAFLVFFDDIPLRWDGLFGVFALLSVSTCISIPMALLHAYLEACKKNVLINNIRSAESLIRIVVLVGLLSAGYRLFAFGLATMITALVSMVAVVAFNLSFFQQLLTLPKPSLPVLREQYQQVKKAIIPLQFRYAQSWMSGIFINSLVIPLVFKLEGKEVAGQLGFSMALVAVILNFSIVLVTSQLPVFATMNAQGHLGLLVQNYTRRHNYSLSLFVGACLLLLTALLVDHLYFHFLKNRFLDYPYFLLLLMVNFVRLFIENKVLFVRSFKVEPFVKVAWIQAMLLILLLPVGTYLVGIGGALMALLAGNLLNLTMTNKIFRQYLAKAA